PPWTGRHPSSWARTRPPARRPTDTQAGAGAPRPPARETAHGAGCPLVSSLLEAVPSPPPPECDRPRHGGPVRPRRRRAQPRRGHERASTLAPASVPRARRSGRDGWHQELCHPGPGTGEQIDDRRVGFNELHPPPVDVVGLPGDDEQCRQPRWARERVRHPAEGEDGLVSSVYRLPG